MNVVLDSHHSSIVAVPNVSQDIKPSAEQISTDIVQLHLPGQLSTPSPSPVVQQTEIVTQHAEEQHQTIDRSKQHGAIIIGQVITDSYFI